MIRACANVSSTRRVPAVLTAWNSSGLPQSALRRAQWTTAVARRASACTSTGASSRMSHSTWWTGGSPDSPVAADDAEAAASLADPAPRDAVAVEVPAPASAVAEARPTEMTGVPRRCSARTTWRPTRPEAPVTMTVMDRRLPGSHRRIRPSG